MKIATSFLAALLLPHAWAFSPAPRPPSRNTALAISVDPMVVAAAGMAVVAGGASVLISAKIREIDAQQASATTPVPSPATAAPAESSSPPAAIPDEKQDLSIPYDAAAQLAYKKAGSQGDYAAFKAKYEADAVADVIAKRKA